MSEYHPKVLPYHSTGEMSVPRTVELASSILTHVTNLEDFLKTAKLPSPSFAPAPPTPPLPGHVNDSVDAALAAMDELTNLLLGPMGWVDKQMQHASDLCSLHAVYKYKIASRVPAGSSVAIADLATQVSVDAGALSRLLQHAVANYMFEQPEPGRIGPTALSLMLADPQMNDWIGVITEDLWPAQPMLVPALATDKTAHQLADASGLPFFETLAKDPARASRLARAMALTLGLPGYKSSAVVDAYDWAGATTESHTVVDVGGSRGEFALALAEKHSDLRIVVQDVPVVIEAAATKKAQEPQVWANVELQPHDFFGPQPVRDADVYFFRMIFHDWSDDKCIEILRQLQPALRPGARILINDCCMPPPGVLSRYHDRAVRCKDLAMFAGLDGKERTEAEWKLLLEKANPAFRLTFVKHLTPSPMGLALLEVVWEP